MLNMLLSSCAVIRLYEQDLIWRWSDLSPSIVRVRYA